jgi:hypothetical protein
MMFVPKFTACAAVAAIASIISINGTQAAMSPIRNYGERPPIHHVDCAVGFHIGPAGACIIGTDDPAPPPAAVVVDGPAPVANEGCSTRTVNRTDAAGNSETKTTTNCPQ